MFRLFAKALGEKSSSDTQEADKVAIIRIVIFSTYLISNIFLIAGVIRHW